MEKLNAALDSELTAIASLKGDLTNVEVLLEDKPVDPENILATVEQREKQIEELQGLLPNLGLFDT